MCLVTDVGLALVVSLLPGVSLAHSKQAPPPLLLGSALAGHLGRL